jgi:valyl-tRNA synthetase
MLALLETKKINLENTEQVWIVDFLLLLIKNIRSFRQKQNINNQIEIYCELIPEWKKKMDNSFDFNQFSVPLAKSKVYFNLPENNQEELFYIIDLKPFGILKIAKQKTDLKRELQEKLNYFQKEYELAQNLLNNEKFVKKAPADLVEKEKKKLSYFTEQKKKTSEQLEKTKKY